MRGLIAVAVLLLAGCAKSPAIPALAAPLYPSAPPFPGMERVQAPATADTCSIPHYLSGPARYRDAPKSAHISLAKDAFHEAGSYAEGVSCYCYVSTSPISLTHGNHRANALTHLGNLFAGELKIERDTLYKMEGGNRYEFEGTVPAMGKTHRMFFAIEAGPTCANLLSVSFDPTDQGASLKASRFIQANGR